MSVVRLSVTASRGPRLRPAGRAAPVCAVLDMSRTSTALRDDLKFWDAAEATADNIQLVFVMGKSIRIRTLPILVSTERFFSIFSILAQIFVHSKWLK